MILHLIPSTYVSGGRSFWSTKPAHQVLYNKKSVRDGPQAVVHRTVGSRFNVLKTITNWWADNRNIIKYKYDLSRRIIYEKSHVIKDELSFLRHRLLAAWILFSTFISIEYVSNNPLAWWKTGINREKSKIVEIHEKKI